mmetsp:Transcript_34653/g.79345  ORF Transcript_34653/g.79345 Transcript_34653/m.79345 type:complete len:689 (-) Transcript_34653:152-2218(-)
MNTSAPVIEWTMDTQERSGDGETRATKPRVVTLALANPDPSRPGSPESMPRRSSLDRQSRSATPEIRNRYRQMKMEVGSGTECPVLEVPAVDFGSSSASCTTQGSAGSDNQRTRPVWTYTSTVSSGSRVQVSVVQRRAEDRPGWQENSASTPHTDTDLQPARARSPVSEDSDIALGARRTRSEELDTSFVAMTRRQAEWDLELDSVDRKQAELFSLQWKMVREQSGTLGRELARVQKQLKELRRESRSAVLELQTSLQETEAKLVEERRSHRETLAAVEHRILSRVQEDLEAQSRTSGVDGIRNELRSLSEELELRLKEHGNYEDGLSKLQQVVSYVVEEVEALKEGVAVETSERKASGESTTRNVRDIWDALQREVRDRAACCEDMLGTMRGALEQEKSDRTLACSSIRSMVVNIQEDYHPAKEEVMAMKNSLQEVEAKVNAKLRDLNRAAERQWADWGATHDRIERKVLDLGAQFEKETTARATLAEETDQLRRMTKAQMKKVMEDHAESARAVRLELKDIMQEQMDKERGTRLAMQEAWQAYIVKQDFAVENLEVAVRTLEQKHTSNGVEVREWELSHLKLIEELAKQGREIREYCQHRVGDERAEREAKCIHLEERVDLNDQLLQDLRKVFTHRPARQRSASAGKAATNSVYSVQLLSSRTPLSREASPQGSSIAGTVAASGGA